MTYFTKPRSWREAHPEDKDAEWDLYDERFRTIDVTDIPATVDTGLLNADDDEIHRRVREAIGFVRFGAAK